MRPFLSSVILFQMSIVLRPLLNVSFKYLASIAMSLRFDTKQERVSNTVSYVISFIHTIPSQSLTVQCL